MGYIKQRIKKRRIEGFFGKGKLEEYERVKRMQEEYLKKRGIQLRKPWYK